MLDKHTIEFIYLLKSKDNTMYNDDDVEDRIRHFITDTYRYDNITNNRILLELENAFLEAVENINKKSLKYFVSEFLRMQKANGSEYAYITSEKDYNIICYSSDNYVYYTHIKNDKVIKICVYENEI